MASLRPSSSPSCSDRLVLSREPAVSPFSPFQKYSGDAFLSGILLAQCAQKASAKMRSIGLRAKVALPQRLNPPPRTTLRNRWTARWRTCIADAFAVPSVRGIYLYGVLPTMRLASPREFLSPMRSSSGDHIFRSTSAWSASAQPCAPRRFICRLGVGEENEASSIGARGMREPNCHWCRRVRVRQRVSLAQSQTKRDRPT